MKWQFRRNWRGKQILQIQDRRPSNSVGDFFYFWRDATNNESMEFTVEIKLLKEKYNIVKKMKEEHPEYFLV